MLKPVDVTSPEFRNAVRDVAEIVRFEHWLRYYFVVEEQDGLRLVVPQETMDQLSGEEEFLHPLADMLNNEPITPEASQATVCSFVGARLDGAKYPIGVCDRVFESGAYKIEMYVFNLWLKGHQSFLEERPHTFAEWREMYDNWRKLDEVKEYVAKLHGQGAEDDGAATIH